MVWRTSLSKWHRTFHISTRIKEEVPRIHSALSLILVFRSNCDTARRTEIKMELSPEENDIKTKKDVIGLESHVVIRNGNAPPDIIITDDVPSTRDFESQTDYRTDCLRLFPNNGADMSWPKPLSFNKVDDTSLIVPPAKRKSPLDDSESAIAREIKKAKLETKALKAKRPGFTDERYNETSYYLENGLRKVYPYYFTFTTFTKGRWVGEKILDVFAREFRAHPVEEYERCIKTGTLMVNYTKVDTDYRLKHNDLLSNIVHRHEVPVTSDAIDIIHMDDDLVVVNKPASIPVHPCGRYRHNTVVFLLAKEKGLKNLRTIHRLDRLTSGLLLFGRSPLKAREMEQQIRNRVVSKEYVCRVEGVFPEEEIECEEPIEVVSYKIGVCKVSKDGKECKTTFKRLSTNGQTSVVLAQPQTGRMHQIRVHLQYLGYPIINDPLYNHPVFGPEKGKAGEIGKSDEQLIQDLISIHNAENWLGVEGEDGVGGGDIFGAASRTTECENQVESPIASSLDSNATVTKDEVETVASDECLASTDSKPDMIVNKDTVPSGSLEQTPETKEEEEIKPSVSEVPGKVTVGTQTCDGDSLEDSVSGNMNDSSTNAKESCSSQEPNSIQTSESVTAAGSNDNNNIKGSDDMQFRKELMTYDPHCYECKVRYRDPKPKDLIMYLHAIKYAGPEWHFETKLPAWASADWLEPEDLSCRP